MATTQQAAHDLHAALADLGTKLANTFGIRRLTAWIAHRF